MIEINVTFKLEGSKLKKILFKSSIDFSRFYGKISRFQSKKLRDVI